MKKIVSSMSRLFEANSGLIVMLLVVRRFWRRIISFVMARSLGAPGLYLGSGCRIIGGRRVCFGKGFHAERNLWLEAVTRWGSQSFLPEIDIGDYVYLSDGVHITSIESIRIGSGCLFGSRIYVSDHNHGIYRGEQQSSPDQPPPYRKLGGGGPVVIGDNVWVGDNAVILGPAMIGKGAIVGANSVVHGVVPANTIVAGAPAKPVKVFNSGSGTWDKA